VGLEFDSAQMCFKISLFLREYVNSAGVFIVETALIIVGEQIFD
jgi:hypothetical protein